MKFIGNINKKYVVVVLALGLSACGSSDSDNSQTSSALSEPIAVEPILVEPVSPVFPPVAPAPEEPTPIVPTPIVPTPIVPMPEDPTPEDPTPEDPTPENPTPIEPEAPAPVEPAPPITPPSNIVKNSIRQYTFNHSLWVHSPSITANTDVGFWLGDMANASGTRYVWNGQFGQLDYHGLPPSPQLGSDNSPDLYPSENTAFRELLLDNILIMPPNFIQGDVTTASGNDIADAQRVIDWVRGEGGQSAASIYIYEHWPEAVSDELTPSQWSQYHDNTTGDYHQWFLDYQNQLVVRYPDADIRMVPVGPIISEILQNNALQASSLSFTDMYEDGAPHGTTNLYFLAALITYQAMYGQPAVDDYSIPGYVHPSIANDFEALNGFVWQRLNYYNNEGVNVWPEAVINALFEVEKITVNNAAELSSALQTTMDGGIISLRAANYGCVKIDVRRHTREAPLIIEGAEDGVIFDGSSCSYTVDIVQSSYVVIRNVDIIAGLDGVRVNESSHIAIDNVDVSLNRQAGIHIGKNSSDIDVVNSAIHNTGMENPQWGECIYVGTGSSQNFPDETVRVWIENNEIHDCGFAEAINIKPEVFQTTVRANRVSNISPGSILYRQYNQSAITVEGGRGSAPDNNHRPNDRREVWVEANVISNVTGGRWNNGIMAGGTGVYVTGNRFEGVDDNDIYVNGYGDLGLPVYVFDNIFSRENALRASSGVNTITDNLSITNPNQRQDWY